MSDLTPAEALQREISGLVYQINQGRGENTRDNNILLAALELALADAVLHEFLELIVPEERSRSVIAKNYAREVEEARIKLYEALKS